MPKDIDKVETGSQDLYFAAELDEQAPELRLDEYAVYSASEVRDEIENGETPSYGNWIPVQSEKTGTVDRAFCQAPAELIEELQTKDLTAGDLFQVTRCARSGPEDHAPYEVNLKVRD